MPRYFTEISYLGTNYSGWQIQDNSMTLQENIESKLSQILRNEISITGCGRTDSGVHASQYYFHFDTEDDIEEPLLVYKLNRMLSHDIGVKRIFEVKENHHARFDASERTYNYRIIFRKDPFFKDIAFLYNQSEIPEFEKVNQAAQMLLSDRKSVV